MAWKLSRFLIIAKNIAAPAYSCEEDQLCPGQTQMLPQRRPMLSALSHRRLGLALLELKKTSRRVVRRLNDVSVEDGDPDVEIDL